MQFENFNLIKCKNMSIENQKMYVKNCFIPLESGDHVIKQLDENNNSILTIVDSKAINTMLNRLPAETKKFYYSENDNVRKLVYKLNKPEMYDDKINLIGKFKHQVKPYNSYNTKIKNAVDKMLKHIKEVVSGDNITSYNFILDWFAYMCHGGKNKTVLYFKGAEGVGKSTLTDFIRVHVIGSQLSLQSGSEPLRSKFNAILAGVLFVTFEELENFSPADWANISSAIKRMSTSDVTVYEKKGIDSFSAENINNYTIISNHDAIKEDHGRRYHKSDIDNKYLGNVEYFNQLYDDCFNDEVGEAFYNLLLERDLTKYNHTKVPETQAKLDSFVNRLCHIALFMKEVFLLRKEDFFGNVGEIYKLFDTYCNKKGFKTCSKVDFCKQLRDWKLDFSRHGNQLKYKIPFDRLLQHANKSHWIHETDEFDIPKQEKSIFVKVEKVEKPKVEKVEKKSNDEYDNKINEIMNIVKTLHKKQPKFTNHLEEINSIVDEINSIVMEVSKRETTLIDIESDDETESNYDTDLEEDYDSDDDPILKHLNLNSLME